MRTLFLLLASALLAATGCGGALSTGAACADDAPCADAGPSVDAVTPAPAPNPGRGAVDASAPPCTSQPCADEDASPPPFDAGDAAALAPCLGGGNVFHVEGDPGNSIYPAAATLGPSDGVWGTSVSGSSLVQVIIGTGNDSEWGFALSSFQESLGEGIYDDVPGPPSASPLTLQLIAAGRWCTPSAATRVTITELATAYDSAGPVLGRVTAFFDQECNGSPAHLRACVHYER